MKLSLFAATLAASAYAADLEQVDEPTTFAAVSDEGDASPWFEGQMFGQVAAESLDFGEAFDDAADFFIQIGEEERNSLGQILLQTKSMTDNFIANMHESDRPSFDAMYAQTRKAAFNWLSQINEEPRARVSEMLSQTSYGQYFMQQSVNEDVAGEINNFFAQMSWNEDAEEDSFVQVDASVDEAELDEMAEFLAQLSEAEMGRLNVLVQTKVNAPEEDDEDFDL